MTVIEQVVHHLFPNICHTHYPTIAPIVMDTCREFDVPYKIFPNVRLTAGTWLRSVTFFSAYFLQSCGGKIWISIQILALHPRLTSCLCTLQFRSALWAHFAHLKEMGAPQLIPSFATVG